MTAIPMPEPVAYWNKAVDHDCAAFSYADNPGYDTPLITTTQAEAYADARVREALEEAMRHVGGNAMDRRHAHRKIRALLPPLPGPVEP